MTKKITIIAPFLSGPLRGNSVHAERKARLLKDAGYQVTMLDGSKALPSALETPDLLIALHAWRTAKAVDHHLAAAPCPFAIVTTGTDVPPGLEKSHQALTQASYQRAEAVIIQHPEQGRELTRAFPDLQLEDKFHHVPPSVQLPESLLPRPAISHAPKILHVSGIRPIKGVGFIPEFMDALWRSYPEARYTLLGAAIESDYAAPVLRWIEARHGAEQVEGLSHVESLRALSNADLLVSTSRHEGLSNALLEAMAHRVPIVCTSIAPNRELIEDGVSGLLYDGKAGFVKALTRLISEEGLAEELSANAYEKVKRDHAPMREREALVEVVEKLTSA